MIDDALKIAPVSAETVGGVNIGAEFFFPIFQGVPLFGPRHDFPIGFGLIGDAGVVGGGIILGVAVAEALGKNLVPDGFLGPATFARAGLLGWGEKGRSRKQNRPKKDSAHEELLLSGEIEVVGGEGGEIGKGNAGGG